MTTERGTNKKSLTEAEVAGEKKKGPARKKKKRNRVRHLKGGGDRDSGKGPTQSLK